MIRILFLCLLVPQAFASYIPVIELDQIKLESILQKVPPALVRSEGEGERETKFYSYPKYDDKGFKLYCEADHFYGSSVPSKVRCSIDVTTVASEFDEVRVIVRDKAVVRNLYRAMPYGTETKEVYSQEKVYGLGINGKLQNLHRYIFSCSEEKCQLTFATKSAD
jgi:hypothetical protein